MSKRILSALLAVLFLITALPSTVWAVGEGNMEAGGGQTETVTGDSFWNGDWGIRFCVVDVASQTVVSATYDAANRSAGYEGHRHYGKTNKFDYRNGASLSGQVGAYGWETPPVTIPTIVRTSGAPDIKAIKNYFTDETVIRWISDVTGMAYDTLINGDYKLFIEPILYFTFDGQKYAMTATEAALFDRNINGLTDGPDRYEIQASANYVATKAGIASGSLWFVAAAVGSAALITILVITLKKRRDNDSEY